MADKKISALTGATIPLDGTEVLPIVQSGTTVKVANNNLRPKQIQSNSTSGVLQITGPAAASTRIATVPDANFTVARTDAAQSFTGDQTLSTGNIIQGTASKGFNFTANTSAAGMTSRLLNWYEEGTWTPTILGGTVAGTPTYTSQVGTYTRTGRQVTLRINLAWTAITGGTGLLLIGGLPFAYNNAFAVCPIAESNLTHTSGTNLVVAMNGGGYSTSQFNLAETGPVTAFTALSVIASGQVFGTVAYFT